MDTRTTKIITSRPGGTASNNSRTYKVALPNSWVSALGLNEENSDRRVNISFDGESIVITPVKDSEGFRDQALSNNHKLITINYYDADLLCTTILADCTTQTLHVENFTSNMVKTAFGMMENPQWSDLMDFLEERCIPRTRSGIREYLETLNIEEYDPIEIIARTQGRMAEDRQWIQIT